MGQGSSTQNVLDRSMGVLIVVESASGGCNCTLMNEMQDEGPDAWRRKSTSDPGKE